MSTKSWFSFSLTIMVVIVSGLYSFGQTPTSSLSGCTFLSAPGTTPAFCETFDQPAGIGNRSGDLNGTLWGVSRLLGGTNSGQGQYYDVSPTMMVKCGQSVEVQPPNDVAICNGQLVEAQSDQHGVTSLAIYAKQPFDIAGRTGTVAFDVSDDTHGSHRAWPEFWYTDKPVPAPFTHFSSLQEVPKDGFGVRFDAFCPANGDPGCGIRPACPEEPMSVGIVSVGSADVINNYATNDSFTDVAPGPISVQVVGCVKASSGPGDMNHFELRISQNEIDVYGVDAGATGPLKKIAIITNMNLTLTRGLIWLEDVHYNGDKDGPDQGTHTFTWDNVAFDGPILPRDLAFDVLDRLEPVGPNYPTLLNLGWPLSPGGPPLTLTAPGVYNIDKAAGAILTFNYSTDNPITLSYRVNSGVWHDQAWPFGACFSQNGSVSCGARTISVPVPLSEVQPGDNTIQFKTADSTNNVGIANVDLILIGAAGIPCTPSCPVSTATALASSPNPTTVGNTVTLTATVTKTAGSAVPTGIVTFTDTTTSTSLGSGALNGAAVATVQASFSSGGAHNVIAAYSGDANYGSSTSAADVITIIAPDYTMTFPSGSTATVKAGSSATYTITVTPQNGFTGVVSFACTSGLPSLASCTFSPTSVTNGNTTLTIMTTAPTAALPASSSLAMKVFGGVGLVGLVFAMGIPRRKRMWKALSLSFGMLVIVAAMASCGGGSSAPPPVMHGSGTPAGTSTVTLTGTSGSTSHTANITLVVQ